MENEEIVCSMCGRIITDDEMIDGNYVCNSCLESNFTKCEDCGDWVRNEDAIWIEDEQKWVCDSCLYDYTYCEHCGNYYREENTRYIEDYGNICDNCYDRGDYGYCEHCECYYRLDDMHWSDSDECYYCDECYDEIIEEEDENADYVYDYHAFKNWHFFSGKDEQNAPYFIGKEIELEPLCYENRNNLSNVMSAMKNHINAVGMHDGSLCGGGVEIVSHPESWLYLQEKKEDYRAFFEDVMRNGYGDNGGTGLHFHVSRPSDDVISKIIIILESFKSEIKKLSRRNGDFSWSHFLTDSGRDKLETLKYRSTKYLKDKYIKDHHDRYMALNLCNKNTIEFRFFNGVNNFEEFWSALQFIHNIMEVALDDTKNVNTINWQDLLGGEELSLQAKKQGVADINKYAKDTTDIMEKLEKTRDEMIKDVKKTLKNFIKYISREMETRRFETINKNDVLEIERNGQDFLNTISNDLNYLHRLTNLYANIDNYSLDDTKYSVENIKHNTRNMNKYSRYFKQIDKSIKTFEEVLD